MNEDATVADRVVAILTQRLGISPDVVTLTAELAEDLGSGHNVRATVFIEVKARYRPDGPEDMRPVGEVEFVEGLATESARGRYGHTRMAAAIIGYADLKLGERVTPVLDAMQAASPTRFRGVRHSTK